MVTSEAERTVLSETGLVSPTAPDFPQALLQAPGSPKPGAALLGLLRWPSRARWRRDLWQARGGVQERSPHQINQLLVEF
jgi:hypothetical protein